MVAPNSISRYCPQYEQSSADFGNHIFGTLVHLSGAAIRFELYLARSGGCIGRLSRCLLGNFHAQNLHVRCWTVRTDSRDGPNRGRLSVAACRAEDTERILILSDAQAVAPNFVTNASGITFTECVVAGSSPASSTFTGL